MGKKIILTTIGIVFILGLAGVLIYSSRKIQNQNVNTTTPIVSTSKEVVDGILINRKGEVYEVNIPTKELSSFQRPEDKIKEFSGLPKEISNKQISIAMTRTLLSQDKTKAIVVFTTFDETQPPSEFDSSLPALKADEFICGIATEKCRATDYLESAYRATGETNKWFENRILWWYRWDSTKNLLYGHLSGEGVGNASPVYIFDLNSKSIKFTTGYNSLNKKEKRAEVPQGAFSPSLQRFIMVEMNGNKWNLLLYDSNNLSAPIKKIDVSSMNDKTYLGSRINSVAWSQDEKILALLTNKQVFTLNLANGEISQRYTDTTQDNSGLWLDFNAVDLSPSGRYIVFIDYDIRRTPYEENKLETVLRAIDLRDNNNVIELLREEGLSLFYQF